MLAVNGRDGRDGRERIDEGSGCDAQERREHAGAELGGHDGTRRNANHNA